MKVGRLPSSPSSVDIALTGVCNLRCSYCFYADEMNGRSDLSTNQWLGIIGELGRLSVLRVCLTGGEVFTRPDLFEIIDGIIDSRMRYSILTNGTLIDESSVRRLSEGRRRLRLDSIQVSIDGPDREVHDEMRPGSFEGAVRAVRLLSGAGFPVNVRMTISAHNLGHIEDTARFLLEDLGLPWFSTNESFRMGSGCEGAARGLSGPGRLEAMRALERLQGRYPGRVRAQAGPLAKLRAYRDMERARAGLEREGSWKMGSLSGCGCVFDKLAILHDGTLVPCHVLHTLRLGNALCNPIGEIWLTHPTLLALRERGTVSMRSIPACAGCEWADYCNGSCPGTALEETGDYNSPDPEDCYARFIRETGVRIGS